MGSEIKHSAVKRALDHKSGFTLTNAKSLDKSRPPLSVFFNKGVELV